MTAGTGFENHTVQPYTFTPSPTPPPTFLMGGGDGEGFLEY